MDKIKTPLNIKLKTPKKPIRKINNLPTDNVEVFCRIRPLESSEDAPCAKKISQNTIALIPADANNPSSRNATTYKESQFTFQEVISEEMSQKDIFNRIAYPMIDDLLHSRNGVLFTYGVTCSGKTFTMNGSASNKGILPRTLDCIFQNLSDYMAKKYTFKVDKMNGFDIQDEVTATQERKSKESGSKFNRKDTVRNVPVDEQARVDGLDYDSLYSIFVSYVEIYNNYVYDLLEDTLVDPICGAKPPISKIIREDSNNNMFINGVVELEVTSSEEAIDLITKGQKRRKVAFTNLNSESSRSHTIFCIRVVQGPVNSAGDYVIMDKRKLILSQLSLVDLAGSERTLRTGNVGERLKEAGNINQSLMVLRTCIEMLRENQKNNTNKMVPYRDSRLTLLFKTYFEGKGKVKMIICVNPKMSDYEENMNVMKFAELTQEVQIARPQVAQVETGLASGRRLANIQLKEALAQSEVMQDVFKSALYSLGPPFPFIKLEESFNEVFLPFLMKFLKERQECRKMLLIDLAKKEEAFRNCLIEMETNLTTLQQQRQQTEELLRCREEAFEEVNRQLAARDQLNTMLESRIAVYEVERRQLEKEIGENSWRVMMAKVEKEGLREEYQQRFLSAEQQYNITLEQTKRKYKDESSAKVRAKQQKIDMLKAILSADSDSASSTDTPVASGRTILRSKMFPSMADVNAPPDENFKTPSGGLYRRNKQMSPPPTTRLKPILTSRRRSKSSDAQLVESKAEIQLNYGKGQASNLKILKTDGKETKKYTPFYQESESKGVQALKPLKGIIASTNVKSQSTIFKPTLTNRKRRSSIETMESEESWTDTEMRCSAATEGNPKKTKFNL